MEFQDHLEALYARAETECAGQLLNARGRAADIDAFTLLYGPWVRVEAYASEELRDWLATAGRITFEEFEEAMGAVPGRRWGEAIAEWDCIAEQEDPLQ